MEKVKGYSISMYSSLKGRGSGLVTVCDTEDVRGTGCSVHMHTINQMLSIGCDSGEMLQAQ